MTAETKVQLSPLTWAVGPKPEHINREGGYWIVPSEDVARAQAAAWAEEGYDDVRAIPLVDGDLAKDLIESLQETTGILSRIYRGESVAGEVLDAIDVARVNLRRATGEG